MKKVLSVVVSLAMILAMAIPGFAMQIGTTVPTEHKVTVNYNDGGFVLVNGKICADGAQFKIDRFGEIDLGVYLENGYHLDSITVNGIDVTDEYVNGNLKISDIVNILFGSYLSVNGPNKIEPSAIPIYIIEIAYPEITLLSG